MSQPGQQIFDVIRKKPVARTPEEEVRQSVIRHLLENLCVPGNLIGVEYSLSNLVPGNMKKVDIIVWQPSTSNPEGRGLAPWLLVECKRPEVNIDDKLILQVSNYLAVVKSRYLWVTNGADNSYFSLEGDSYTAVAGVPTYPG